MEFTFIDEDTVEDEDTLDLSDIFEQEDSDDNTGLEFEDDIPQAKTLSDPKVKDKAASSRKAKTVDYETNIKNGVAFYCARHPFNEYEFDRSRPHYSNLCEKDQSRGQITCTCSCHDFRNYTRPESKYVPGSDDEEILLLSD